MFKSVLIVEDHRSMNFWLQQTLKELGIERSFYAYYCDDAVLRLKHAIQENQPFDVLITDLSFAADGRKQMITHGKALIEVAKKLQPDLKVLVFSAETDAAVAKSLFDQFSINGYVPKGRQDAQDLKNAIESISKGKKYVPAALQQTIRHKNAHDFSTYDTMIISQLAEGTLQKDIPAYLQQKGTRASSLSSVEKRLNQIREALGFTKNEQLVAYCKDHKII